MHVFTRYLLLHFLPPRFPVSLKLAQVEGAQRASTHQNLSEMLSSFGLERLYRESKALGGKLVVMDLVLLIHEFLFIFAGLGISTAERPELSAASRWVI